MELTKALSELRRPEKISGSEHGCRCPILDNNHGGGCGYRDDDGPLFWINEDGPLHGKDAEVTLCGKT
jgi:hypothetical protein